MSRGGLRIIILYVGLAMVLSDFLHLSNTDPLAIMGITACIVYTISKKRLGALMTVIIILREDGCFS